MTYFSVKCFLPITALLEEKRNIGTIALVTQRTRPFKIHRAFVGACFRAAE
jgi:hypothetical protein